MPQGDVPPMGGDMPPMGGAPQGDGNGESEFDTGFDGGVEADEDADPKKFIQQLTGKLSQSLNSYENETGGDEELAKYVGKMIVKAAAKSLDEKGKKDLIKAINTAGAGDGDEDIEDVGGEESTEDEPVEEPQDVGMEEPPMEDEPLNESIEKLGKMLGI